MTQTASYESMLIRMNDINHNNNNNKGPIWDHFWNYITLSDDLQMWLLSVFFCVAFLFRFGIWTDAVPTLAI